jgi:hypothetical protein
VNEKDAALASLEDIKDAFNDLAVSINVAGKTRKTSDLYALFNQAGASRSRIGMNLLSLKNVLSRVTITPAVDNPPSADEVDIEVTLTGPTAGSSATLPTTVTVSATVSDEADTEKVELYRNADRIAIVTTPTAGVYSYADVDPPAGVHQYRARAFDTEFGFVESELHTVIINPEVVTPPPPATPAVALVLPADASTVTLPTTVAISATSDDTANTQKIEFYRGATLVGTDTTPSGDTYSVNDVNPPAGVHQYTALLYDNQTPTPGTARSSASTVTVNAEPIVLPPPATPTVALTSPTTGTVAELPTTVTVSATSNDVANTQKIEFYRGATLIGTDTTASGSTYSVTDVDPPAGVHQYTALLYDNQTPTPGTARSSAATVTINAQTTGFKVNVAAATRGSVGTATTTISHLNPNFPLDGSDSTWWAPSAPNRFPETWTVTFPTSHPIEEIVLISPNSASSLLGLKDFRVEYLSNSGWVVLQTVLNNTAASVTLASPTSSVPIVMSALRVVVLGAHPNGYARIAEVQANTRNPTNVPPVITITSPTKTTFTDSEDAVMSATITDPDGDPIQKVEFIVMMGTTEVIADTATSASTGNTWSRSVNLATATTGLKFRAYDTATRFSEKSVAITVTDSAAAPVTQPAWATATPETWAEIPGSAPVNFAAACRAPWDTTGTATFVKATFWNWNGIQVDVKRGIVYNSLSGGHRSTIEQNGVYKCDLNLASPAWSTVRHSTSHVIGADTNPHFPDPDNRPKGRHTYGMGGVVEINGSPAIVHAVGNQTITAAGHVLNPRAECFRIDRGDWDRLNRDPTDNVQWPLFPTTMSGSVELGSFAFDHRTNRIWFFSGATAGIYYLDTGTKRWTQFTSADVTSGPGGGCIDTKRNLLVFAHNVRISQFSQTGPSGLTVVNLTTGAVTNQLVTGSVGWTWGTGHANQIIYDNVKDRYIHFSEKTAAVNAIDPGSYVSTALPSFTNVEQPGNADGPQGKFAYIPMWGIVIYVRGYNDNIRYMRFTVPAPTALETDYVPLVDGFFQTSSGAWSLHGADFIQDRGGEGAVALMAHNGLSEPHTWWDGGPFGNYRDICRWKRNGGDWRDRGGTLHGSSAFASAVIPSPATTNQSMRLGAASGAAGAAMAEGVQKHRTTVNHGWYIRYTLDSLHMVGTAHYFAGRTHATSTLHPKITCITSGGTYVCPVTVNIGMPSGSGMSATLHNGGKPSESLPGARHPIPLLLKFDYSSIPSGEVVTHAYIDLVCTRSLSSNLSFSAFLLEMPPLIREPRRQYAQIGKTKRDSDGIVVDHGGDEIAIRTLKNPSNKMEGYLDPRVLRAPRLNSQAAMLDEFEVKAGRTYSSTPGSATGTGGLVFPCTYHPITWDGNIEAVRCELSPTASGTAGYWGHLMFQALSSSLLRYPFQVVAPTQSAHLQEVYCRFGVKIHSNWAVGSQDGTKLSGPNGTHDITPYGSNTNPILENNDSASNFYWQAHMKKRQATLPGIYRMEGYEYSARNAVYPNGRDGDKRGAITVWDCVMVHDRITWIEMRLKLNTPITSLHDQVMALPYPYRTLGYPGITPYPPQPVDQPIGMANRRYQSNGEMQVWVDNVEVYYDPAVLVRNNPWVNILDFWWQLFHGGANGILSPVTVESGGIVIATSFIGMPYAYR